MGTFPVPRTYKFSRYANFILLQTGSTLAFLIRFYSPSLYIGTSIPDVFSQAWRGSIFSIHYILDLDLFLPQRFFFAQMFAPKFHSECPMASKRFLIQTA